jgi:hypothetical protein
LCRRKFGFDDGAELGLLLGLELVSEDVRNTSSKNNHKKVEQHVDYGNKIMKL